MQNESRPQRSGLRPHGNQATCWIFLGIAATLGWLVSLGGAEYGTGERPPAPPPVRTAPPPNASPGAAALMTAASEQAVRAAPSPDPESKQAGDQLKEIRDKIGAGKEGGTTLFATPSPSMHSEVAKDALKKRFMREQALPQSEQATAVFVDKCSSCHGVQGYGDGPWHTEFTPQPANLSLVNDSPEMVRSIVLNGIPGTMMPAFPQTGNEVLENMLLYVSLQPRDLSNQWGHPWELHSKLGSQMEKPDLNAGKQQFASSCAGCHGTGGEGDGIMAQVPTIWPRPTNLVARSSDVGRLYQIISEGRPGTFMPYSKDKIPELGRWQVANYVQSLYKPDAKAQMRQPSGKIPTYTNPYVRVDARVTEYGRQRYGLWCAPCHGDAGRGTFLAPRLIDRSWKYANGTDTAVFTIVQEGIPGRLMVGFKKLEANERWAIITFLRSMGGLPDPIASAERARPPTGSPAETSKPGQEKPGKAQP